MYFLFVCLGEFLRRNSMDLELQVFVKLHVVLGTEPGSSAGAASALATEPPLQLLSFLSLLLMLISL